MKRTFTQIVLLVMIVSITSCSKKQDAMNQTEVVTSNPEKVLQYIKDLGFSASSIVDNGNEYIVEEDIIFPKTMEVPAITGGAKTEQYYTGSIVNSTNKLNIRVYVDPSMTSMIDEINSGLLQWNSIEGSTLRFNIVAAAPYDIIIKDDPSLGSTTCGSGTFPSGGKAGGTILIHKSVIAGNTFAQRARTICHEFGHNISLRHTNWSSRGESTATNVPGVGGTDAASLMNGGQCNSGATVLSANDKAAVASLY